MKNKLKITEEHWKRLSKGLRADKQEQMGGAYLGFYRTDETNVYTVLDSWIHDPSDYSFQNIGGVGIHADANARVFGKAIKLQAAGILDAHSHPGKAFISHTDDHGHQNEGGTLERLRKTRLALNLGILIRMVVGASPNNIYADVALPEKGFEPIHLIEVHKSSGRIDIVPVNSPFEEYVPETEFLERHSRTLEFIESYKAQKLEDLEITVLGTGGTGSAFINLAKFHCRKLNLCDADRLEKSNCNRFFGAVNEDVGDLKVNAIRRDLLRFRPNMEIRAIPRFFPENETLEVAKNSDLIVVSPDNDWTRYHAFEFGLRYGIPIIELGSGVSLHNGKLERMQAQVRLQIPGAPCGLCLGLPDDNLEDPWLADYKHRVGYVEDKNTGHAQSPASVATLNMAVANMGMVLARRYFCHELGMERGLPHYLVWDEISLRVFDLTSQFPHRKSCPLCGENRISSSYWMRGDTLPTWMELMDPPGECLQQAV